MKLCPTLTSGLLLIGLAPLAQAQAQETPPPAAEPAPAAPASAKDESALVLRFDCLHDFNLDEGSAQSCFTLSGIRYTFREDLSPNVHGMIRLDPFAPVASSRAATPLRQGLPTVRDTDFLIVDDYALVWTPRQNLEISMEEYDGSAAIPSVSGLSLGSPFADTGWDQTALTATY